MKFERKEKCTYEDRVKWHKYSTGWEGMADPWPIEMCVLTKPGEVFPELIATSSSTICANRHHTN